MRETKIILHNQRAKDSNNQCGSKKAIWVKPIGIIVFEQSNAVNGGKTTDALETGTDSGPS